MSGLPKLKLARLKGVTEEVEVDLSMPVSDFVQTVAERFKIDPTKAKLICSGKRLKHDMGKTLSQMKIKPGDKVIVLNKPQLKVTGTPSPSPGPPDTDREETKGDPPATAGGADDKPKDTSLQDAISRQEKLKQIRESAEALAKRSNDGFDWNSKHYLELTNQNGQAIVLPESDRQSLTMGMTLHEKGKQFMLRKEYDDALMLLNFAFESYSQCDKKWLDIIDNYGFCALDIVWLYYLKQDEKQLLHASRWLDIALYSLRRAHGPNMERLRDLRGGGFCPEMALYVRVNVLRALVCFYQQNIPAAQAWIDQAARDLRTLQLSDKDLAHMESMGFTLKEARRALRLCDSDMERAVQHVFQKRAEAEERAAAERERRRERARARAYGKTAGGRFVDLKMLDSLKGMGIFEEIAVEVLRQTDNHYENTMEYCLDPDRKAVIEGTIIRRAMKGSMKVDQLIQLGYREGQARAALVVNNDDLDRAIDVLSAPSLEQQEQLERLEARLAVEIMAREEREKQRALQDIMMAEAQVASAAESGQDTDAAQASDVEMPDAAYGAGGAAEEDAMVEPANLDASAFPNPHLGDGDEKDETKEVNIRDTFEPVEVAAPDDTDRNIAENVLDEWEDDPEAYLDVELDDETRAVQQIQMMLASISDQ